MEHCNFSEDCAGCVTYGETLMSVRNVSLKFGNKTILRDVNAQVLDVQRHRCNIKQGQVVGFLAPSGMGKTQLLRIIAGLQEPTSGTVEVAGKPTSPGKVGVVFQSYPLFEHRTVLGNLRLAAKKRYPGKKEIAEAIDYYLTAFDLMDKKPCYPAQLSGGQRQRIAIIQQLLCSEHFILMDEPFSGLDLVQLEKVEKMITDVANLDELNTIIVVTHDVTAAASVADHLWLMGRDYDEYSKPIAGARIQENYDMVEKGLCWQEMITVKPEFLEFVKQVKERFRTL